MSISATTTKQGPANRLLESNEYRSNSDNIEATQDGLYNNLNGMIYV